MADKGKKVKFEDTLNPIEEKDFKKIVNLRGEQMEEASQMGATTENLLTDAGLIQKLIEFSQMQVPTGKKIGIIPSLMEGGGVLKENRRQETAPLGFEKAVPLLKDLLSLTEATKTPAEKLKTKEQEASATARGGALGKQEVATDELNQALNVYFEVANNQPTGEGLERFTVGMENMIQGIEQKSPAGLATANMNRLNKWLRVKLVRKAGDVGNLNIVEQLAAEQLLFNNFDSTQMRGLKKTFLTAIAEGTNANNPQKIKDAVNQWMKSPGYEKVTPTFKSVEEVRKSNVPFGTKVNINGVEYIWQKKEKKK